MNRIGSIVLLLFKGHVIARQKISISVLTCGGYQCNFEFFFCGIRRTEQN